MEQMIGSAELRRRAGFFTVIDVAKQLGISEFAFYHQLRSGRWPRPATRVGHGRRCYYSPKEVKELKRENEKTRVGWCYSGSIILFKKAAKNAIIHGHST